MLSNAFLKSTKQLKIFLPFRRAFSAISLRARIFVGNGITVLNVNIVVILRQRKFINFIFKFDK